MAAWVEVLNYSSAGKTLAPSQASRKERLKSVQTQIITWAALKAEE